MTRTTEPPSRLLRFRQALEQLIEDSLPGPGDSLSGGPPVPLDVFVHASRVEIHVELPGLKPEAIEVSATGRHLCVEGVRPSRPRPTGSYLCLESASGRFRRVIELPVPSDVRRAVATLRDGVLIIDVPRIEDRRGAPHQVQVARR